jgi:hypothetical protein
VNPSQNYAVTTELTILDIVQKNNAFTLSSKDKTITRFETKLLKEGHIKVLLTIGRYKRSWELRLVDLESTICDFRGIMKDSLLRI